MTPFSEVKQGFEQQRLDRLRAMPPLFEGHAGGRPPKRTCVQGFRKPFPSVKAAAEAIGVEPCNLSRAIAKKLRIRKRKVWFADEAAA